MLIATRNQEDLRVIVWACDTCGRPIRNLEEAVVVWGSTRLPTGDWVCKLVHAGQCDNREEHPCSEELKQTFYYWLKEVYKQPDFKKWLLPSYASPHKDDPRKFPNHIRRQIFQRDDFKCVLCGQGPPEVAIEADHKIPYSRGGSSVLENGQTLCFRCNRGKYTKMDHE